MKIENEKNIFVEWLKKVIKIDNRITGKELAARLGVHPSTISGYLTGKRSGPGKAVRFKICEILGEDYSNVVGIEEYSNEYQKRIQQQENEYYEKHPEKLEQLKWEWKHDVPPDLDLDILAEKVADKLKVHAPISDLTNKKIEKHQKLIGGFEHQDIAIEINQALLELEKIAGKDGLLEIKGVLRQMLREAEKKRVAANGTEGS